MEHFVEALPNWLVLAFVVVNMLGLGMGLSPKEIVAPLRNIAGTSKILFGNFVLVPVTAFYLRDLLELNHGFGLGLMLLACSAGDPFVTKLSESARGDRAYSLAVMTLLSVVTVVYMPIALPVLLPGTQVDAFEIAKPLVLMIIVPLSIGLIIRARWIVTAEKWGPRFDKFASFLIYAAVSLFAVVHFSDIKDSLGSHAILAAVLLVATAFFFGYFLGGPVQKHRGDLAVNTSWRGVSAAMAVGIRNFPGEPNVFTMAIILVLVSSIMLLPTAATFLRRRNLAA